MKKLFFLWGLFFVFSLSLEANPLRVVTSTTDLADLVRSIGGDKVIVTSLVSGVYNLHQIEARPSMVAKVSQADLVMRVGMGLDGWMDSVIDSARNPKIRMGTPGYVDMSHGIHKLEVPQHRINGSMGDIHVQGNPHYWLDPDNGLVMAKTIRNALVKLSPENRAYFENRFSIFSQQLREKIERWNRDFQPYRGMKVIVFHKSWPYLAEHFTLSVVDEIEPKPGIPPSPQHLLSVIIQAKKMGVSAVIAAPYDNLKACEKVAKDVGVPLLVVPTSVGGAATIRSYSDIFDSFIRVVKGKIK